MVKSGNHDNNYRGNVAITSERITSIYVRLVIKTKSQPGTILYLDGTMAIYGRQLALDILVT